MALKKFNANEYKVKLKATIHSSGKLGFTDATARVLGLDTSGGIVFATEDGEQNEKEKPLYLICCKVFEDGAFKVTKAGNYFSVNAKGLFDSLGYDYKKNTIIFDMIQAKEEGENVYKLVKREKPKK